MLRRIAWRNVRANPVRFLGTMLAVILATTFLASALTARDSLADALTTNAVSALGQVDLAVEPAAPVGSGGDPFASDAAGVPVATRDRVGNVAGVAAVLGQASGTVELPGPEGSRRGSAWVVQDSPLLPWQVADGRLPVGQGEVAVDGDSADVLDLAVGDMVTLTTSIGPRDVEVVGLSTYGQQAARGQADVLVSEADGDAFADLAGAGWTSVLVQLDDGADTDSVADSIRTAIDADTADLSVIDGDQLRDREAGQAAGLATGLGIGLQVFAYLALLVGALIIFNTFTTVVAQRTREFALLRAIGTSARQVRRAVRLEALVVATVASVIGMALGAGLVALAIAVVPAVGNFADFAVRPWSIVQVLASGIIVTMASAFIPAWRASRTRPVEAMRDADPTIKPPSRVRSIIGLAALAIGAAALGGGSMIGNWYLMGGGAVALFIGVLVAGPTMVAWLARLLRRPLARTSMADELAVAEAERNSRRTAATANALVIGVFLVVFATSAGGALRDYAVEQIGQFAGADVSVAAFDGRPLRPELAEAVAGVDGLEAVAALNQQVGMLQVESLQGLPVAAVDMEQFQVLGLTVSEGEVDSDGIVLAGEIATASGVGVGDEVTVEFQDGTTRDLAVTALTNFSLEVPPAIVDLGLATAAVGTEIPVTTLSAQFAPDADHDVVRADITTIADDYAGIEVLDANLFVSLVRTFFNFLLSAVAGLLGVAVVIALFGILNTLVLAIAERTRELGLLRSVGMTRTQLRRMIRTEALVTSVVGTVIGAGMGIAVSFAITRVALEGAFTWPWWELGLTIVAGVVTGVLASLFPAWRAARLNPLDAIRTN